MMMSMTQHLTQQTATQSGPARGQHEDSAWTAVLARDRSASFIYAVTTTGICCRPSCPSRRPAREHALFFETVTEALQAGFRPCLRCRPAEENPEARRDAMLVKKLSDFLRANVDRTVTLDELGKRARLPGLTVQRKFERVLGVTPKRFQLELRASGFRSLLGSQPGGQITDAVYEAGYSASSRLYTDAQEKLGMKPTRFRDGGRGETIQFVTAVSALGYVLVAATKIGICWVALGETSEALESELRQRFCHAVVIRESPDAADVLQTALNTVLAQLTDHPTATALPLDLRATVFQQRVWKALTTIPRGETRSYSQVVPCHRVIGATGDLTGYRWGKERKQKLLDLERSPGHHIAG
jgi:AraC family transcriptional regulator of adaptative response/methylated-DNA-[protein]-cysteine methyltransferase